MTGSRSVSSHYKSGILESATFNKHRHENALQPVENNTFGADILKSVIRENWKERIGTSEKLNKAMLNALDEHVNSMRVLLNTLDYEVLGMPNVVVNSKKMQRTEVAAYLAAIEAMAYGYTNLFGRELTNVIMIGLSYKAKDLNTASNYMGLLTNEVEKRAGSYTVKIGRESKSLERTSIQLRRAQSGLLRFFRGKKMIRLRKKIQKSSTSINRLKMKRSKYTDLLDGIKEKSKKPGVAAPNPASDPKPQK
jgi:hypothetical protein